MDITFHPDGTYEEAGGNGRWVTRDNAIHLQITKSPTVTFISAYPELMALDDDGRLPFLDTGEVEAASGRLTKRFHRCR